MQVNKDEPSSRGHRRPDREAAQAASPLGPAATLPSSHISVSMQQRQPVSAQPGVSSPADCSQHRGSTDLPAQLPGTVCGRLSEGLGSPVLPHTSQGIPQAVPQGGLSAQQPAGSFSFCCVPAAALESGGTARSAQEHEASTQQPRQPETAGQAAESAEPVSPAETGQSPCQQLQPRQSEAAAGPSPASAHSQDGEDASCDIDICAHDGGPEPSVSPMAER